MYLLIEVDSMEDAGKNEKRRLLVDKIIIHPASLISSFITCAATDVHPMTIEESESGVRDVQVV